jgi:hypothetical protein
MKVIVKNQSALMILCLILNFNCKLFSQSDSSQINYSQESADSSDYNYHRKYQYLDINLKEETKMFKIAVPTFSIRHTKDPRVSSINSEDFSLYFTFEKKINPSWSFLIEDVNGGSIAATTSFWSNLDWGIRYYFLMKNRIKKGISGNNCNGVYADFFLLNLNCFQFTHEIFSNGNYFNITSNFYDFHELFNTSPTLNLNLGLQKRLNNFSFIDAKIYFEFTPASKYYYHTVEYYPDYQYKVVTGHDWYKSYFISGLNFKIGLGWGRK